MTLYDHVSVSHEVSSSESEAGGEAVEATLRALAALKSVQRTTSPTHGATLSLKSQVTSSQRSQAKTHASMRAGTSASHKSRTVSQASMGSHASASQKNRGAALSVSKDSRSSQTRQGSTASNMRSASNSTSTNYSRSTGFQQAPSNKVMSTSAKSYQTSESESASHPYRVPSHDEHEAWPTSEKPKRGGIFSCCFRADEQVDERSSYKTKSSPPSLHSDEQHKTRSEEGDESNKHEGNDRPVQGLTDYERAMIERLRELLSLDTSIPTLPTQVELKSKTSPVSLDITNSMMTRSFSIDTKERMGPQADPYRAVGEGTSFERERSTNRSVHRSAPSLPSSRQEPKSSMSHASSRIASQVNKKSISDESVASTRVKSNAMNLNESSIRGKSTTSATDSIKSTISRRSGPGGSQSRSTNSMDKRSSAAPIEKKTSRTLRLKKSFSSKSQKQGLPPKPEMIKSTVSANSSKSKRSDASRGANRDDAQGEMESIKPSKSFAISSATSNKVPVLRHSRSGGSRNSSHLHESAMEGILPPRPEMSRSRDASETIIPTQSSNQSEFEQEDGFECIYQLKEDTVNNRELQQVYSEDYLRQRQEYEAKLLRRVATANPRIGELQPLTEFRNRNSGEATGKNIQDENIPPAARAASKLLSKDPKDLRDDISALSMLSPKNPNMPSNARSLTGPRKIDMLDMLSGGVFCCNADASNAVISP